MLVIYYSVKKWGKGLPWSVDKGLPANAGDTGSIPGLGKFHRLRSYQAHVLQLLSLCSAKREATAMRSSHHNKEWPLFAATRECLRQPHVQGAVAARAQEGIEELSHVEGQEGQQ